MHILFFKEVLVIVRWSTRHAYFWLGVYMYHLLKRIVRKTFKTVVLIDSSSAFIINQLEILFQR